MCPNTKKLKFKMSLWHESFSHKSFIYKHLNKVFTRTGPMFGSAYGWKRMLVRLKEGL